jgi:hypothetical protein
MLVALRLILWGGRWQSDELERSTQGVNHTQHVFQPERGLACFKVDDEAHTNACSQSQLRLCQAQLLACRTQRVTELFCGLYGAHHWFYLPIGKLLANSKKKASYFSRSGIFRERVSFFAEISRTGNFRTPGWLLTRQKSTNSSVITGFPAVMNQQVRNDREER